MAHILQCHAVHKFEHLQTHYNALLALPNATDFIRTFWVCWMHLKAPLHHICNFFHVNICLRLRCIWLVKISNARSHESTPKIHSLGTWMKVHASRCWWLPYGEIKNRQWFFWKCSGRARTHTCSTVDIYWFHLFRVSRSDMWNKQQGKDIKLQWNGNSTNCNDYFFAYLFLQFIVYFCRSNGISLPRLRQWFGKRQFVGRL